MALMSQALRRGITYRYERDVVESNLPKITAELGSAVITGTCQRPAVFLEVPELCKLIRQHDMCLYTYIKMFQDPRDLHLGIGTSHAIEVIIDLIKEGAGRHLDTGCTRRQNHL